MQNYMNPFGMMPQNSDFASPSFLQVLMAHQNRNMSMPFIQNAQSMQQMEMEKMAQQNKEFMDPAAAEARMTGFQADAAVNRQRAESAPVLGEKEREEAKAKIKALPYITQKEIAQAEQLAIEAKGKPAERLITEMSSVYDMIERQPEAMRPAAYQQMIEAWKVRNPGQSVPPNMRQYNPQLLAMLKYASVNTPEHVQNLEKEKLKGLFSLEGKNIEAESRTTAAATTAAGGSSNKRSPAQERVHQMRVYNDPRALPEDREVAYETLEGLASDMFNNQIKKQDRALANMDLDYIRANTPQEKEQVTKRQTARESQLWEEHLIKFGLRVKVTSPQGQTGTIPKHKLQEYKQQGYKEVR